MERKVRKAAKNIEKKCCLEPIFGQIIILIVYLPILALVGIEGKMFSPMAQTVSFAIIGALILSLTYIPMMCAAFLPKTISHKPTFSDRMMNFFQRIYAPLLEKAIRFKKVIVVANKADNHELSNYAAEFYKFGLGEIYAISAISGAGTGDMLDALVELLPKDEGAINQIDLPKIAIVGRPNVGKSSLTNALLGEERTIVTDIAGTTRDTINTRYNKFGHDFWLIDTAGMRKKAKVHEDLEFYSVMRTINAIEHSDVCVLMIDATQGDIESQDLNIIHLIVKNHKGIVIVVNKWDLIEDKQTMTTKYFEEKIRESMAPFKDVPIIFTSVTEKQRIMKVIDAAMEVYENKSTKIPTSKLNEYFLPLIENYPPPAVKGKIVKVLVNDATPVEYDQPLFLVDPS